MHANLANVSSHLIFPISASTHICQKNLLAFCAMIHQTCQTVLLVLVQICIVYESKCSSPKQKLKEEIKYKQCVTYKSKCSSPKQNLKEENITWTHKLYEQMFKP